MSTLQTVESFYFIFLNRYSLLAEILGDNASRHYADWVLSLSLKLVWTMTIENAVHTVQLIHLQLQILRRQTH